MTELNRTAAVSVPKITYVTTVSIRLFVNNGKCNTTSAVM